MKLPELNKTYAKKDGTKSATVVKIEAIITMENGEGKRKEFLFDEFNKHFGVQEPPKPKTPHKTPHKTPPTVCPDCKGEGGYADMNSHWCNSCPKEGCCGPRDNPKCSIIYCKCGRCKGKGIINAPNSPMRYFDPLAPYRH